MSNTFYEAAGQNWFTLDSVHIHYNWTQEATFNASEVYAPATSSYHCQHVSSLHKYDTLLVPSSHTDTSANWHITFTDFQVHLSTRVAALFFCVPTSCPFPIYPLRSACVLVVASLFLLWPTFLAVGQTAPLFTVCLAVRQSVCSLSLLAICRAVSSRPSVCLVSQLSSFVEANLVTLSSLCLSPDPGLQRAVRQVCLGQRLRHLLDAGHPDGLGHVSDPAPCLGLRPAHGGAPQAHRPLRRTQSHSLLPPQSGGRAAGQEQPVREEGKVEDQSLRREEHAKLRAGVQVNSVKKVSSKEHFFPSKLQLCLLI